MKIKVSVKELNKGNKNYLVLRILGGPCSHFSGNDFLSDKFIKFTSPFFAIDITTQGCRHNVLKDLDP